MRRTVLTRVVSAIAAATTLAIVGSSALAQFEVGPPSDDVWAYAHAQDPGGEPVLRIWGVDGTDVNPTGYPGQPGSEFYFSYAYLSFDLSDVPPDHQWNGATITLTIAPETVYNPAVNDTYVRLLSGGFDESTWFWGDPPGPIGGDSNRVLADDSDPDVITIGIPRNVPRNVLRRWASNRRMDLAITSTADYLNDRQILRVASKENLLYDGPRLVLH